jgi:ABC-2 type transport system permease protein
MIAQVSLKFNKYFEIAKITYYDSTAYMGDVLGMAGLIAVRIWMFSQLYTLAFKVSNSTEVGGLSLAQTIWILALTQSFHVSNRTRKVMKDIEYEIKNGNIAYSISKPYSYLWFNFSACLGVIGGHIFITTIIALITAALLVGLVKVTVGALIVGSILLVFGFIMNTLAILMIGLLAFWSEDISAYRWIYDKLLWVFGGIFLPVSLFPEKYKTLLEILPFNHMFYMPARIMIEGQTDLFFKYFLIQAFWIIIFGAILSFVYRRGIKQISINAG